MKALTKSLIAATVSLAALSAPAYADDYRIERVTFASSGQTIVGDLYIPAGVDRNNPAEAAVVTGAWTTIKEHMAGTYAAALAERGHVALAFDFRTWGESGGETRSLENPAMKIADIKAAGRFLASRPEVSEVNGLGICASAGYMATAAEETDIFASVALVAPWLHDAELVEEIYGGPEAVAQLIDLSRKAAAKEARTGEPQLIPATGPEGSDALMPGVDYYPVEGLGLIPEWDNTWNNASWEGWLTFDGIRTAAGIDEPTLIVHSEAAAIPSGAREFYAGLRGPKSELWLDDVTQFQFYYEEEPVEASADAAAAWFDKT